MKNSTILATLLSVVTLFSISAANASVCKPAVTVTTTLTGKFSNMASAQGIVQATINRLSRKWVLAATKRYGNQFIHIARGTCTCEFINEDGIIGEKVGLSCMLTANACDHLQVLLNKFTCTPK